MSDDRSNYNSMQQQAGILPPFAAVAPQTMSSAQVSAQVAAMGSAQLSQMMAVTQIGRQPMGPFGSPSFPQLQTPFVGMPGVMPGPGGALYPMTPAGSPSPYMGSMGAGYGVPSMGMAGQMTPPGNMYRAGPMGPPPIYGGAMGMPGLAPFSPPPPPTMFDTPYQGAFAQAAATSNRGFAGMMTGFGMGARMGMDTGMGVLGARIGNQFGGRPGALIGGALGFIGSEVSGMAGFAQNTFMDHIAGPAMNTRSYGTGLEHISRGFVSGGPELSGSGSGWSHAASTRAAGMLQDLSQSSSFQRETFNRFNTADVMRIAQGAGQEGLLSGVQTGGDMKGRVRELSRSLVSVMELANEPDVLRAIQVMGQMRTSGLSMGETQRAVQNGRLFARMAGTTFESLANTGGAMGSSAFQSLGLTQGLGMVTGMANHGMAVGAQNTGMLSPQLLNLLGGAQGLGGMNTMFSAGMLQMPMMAPGMMNAQGGLDPAALRSLLSGQISPMGMTGRGTNTFSEMGRTMGVGGMGMALAMQPLLQDSIGRIVQSQGPFAQRHMEDRQMLSLMRNMGLSGSEGFMTSAQMMGMSGSQAMARAQELGDPRYHSRQRQQIEVQRRERRAEEMRDMEAMEPSWWESAQERYGIAAGLGRAGRGIERSVGGAYRSLAGGGASALYAPSSRDDHNRLRSMVGSSDYWEGLQGRQLGFGGEGAFSRLDRSISLAELHGGRGIGASIGGLLRGSTDSEARAYRETGRFLSTALNASNQTQSAAMESLGSTFGGREGLTDFSSRVAGLYGTSRGMFGGLGGAGANLAMRGGLSVLTRGFFDGDNIAGSSAVTLGQMRGAYVRSMHGRNGMSDAELGQHFDTNRSSIATQMGTEVGGYMTIEQRARMRREMTAMSNLSTGGAELDAEESERGAYRGILGGNASSRSARRSADQLFQFAGFGRGDSARRASSQYMAARAALQVQLQSETDPRRQERIRDQLRSLDAEGTRQGVDVREANRRVNARSDALQGDSNLRDALHGVNLGDTGADIFRRFGEARGGIDRATADRRVVGGLNMLGGQDGILGSAFSGVVENGRVNVDRLRGQIGNVGSDEGRMRELAARDPRLARLFRQYSTGSHSEREAAFSQIGQYIAAQGERSDTLRREHSEQGAMGRAWQRMRNGGDVSFNPFTNIYRALSGATQSADEYVRSKAGGGTRADADAIRQTGDSAAMEGEARGAGMGGASDRLIQAAETIERAGNAFLSGIREQGMEGLFNQAVPR